MSSPKVARVKSSNSALRWLSQYLDASTVGDTEAQSMFGLFPWALTALQMEMPQFHSSNASSALSLQCPGVGSVGECQQLCTKNPRCSAAPVGIHFCESYGERYSQA